MTEVTWRQQQQQQKDLPIEGASTPSFRSLLQNHFLFLKNNFIYLFVFGCARSSLLHRLVSTCVEGGCSLVAVRELLIAVAYLVEHGL